MFITRSFHIYLSIYLSNVILSIYLSDISINLDTGRNFFLSASSRLRTCSASLWLGTKSHLLFAAALIENIYWTFHLLQLNKTTENDSWYILKRFSGKRDIFLWIQEIIKKYLSLFFFFLPSVIPFQPSTDKEV